jgi:bis(5'-nucleosyl)-tetraphosphatase (symmetrical)
MRLLERIRFDRGRDRLWLVGDLVNRGPESLDVLRTLTDLGSAVTAVLGNHDLHLLARGAGLVGPRRQDTLDEVLGAPDASSLLTWLRHRPLMVREGDWVMVHAGLSPAWTLEGAEVRARAVEAWLRDPSWTKLLAPSPRGAGKKSSAPSRDVDGELATERSTLAVMTRMRMVTRHGEPDFEFKGAPAGAGPGLIPWFKARHARPVSTTVVFGHWSTLGLHRGPGVVALDTGCVWGGPLTAMRLEDGQVIQVTGTRRPVAPDRE